MIKMSVATPCKHKMATSTEVDTSFAQLNEPKHEQQAADESDIYEERFRVDRRKLEHMIQDGEGENGSAEAFFNGVMEKTGTQITWPSKLKIGAKSKKDPHIKVAGTPETVQAAKEIIMGVLDTKSTRVTLKMDVAHTEHSHVIGKGGNNIKQVMQETGCHIHFPDSNRNTQNEKSNQVSIAGQPDDVELARQKIRELLPLVFMFDLPVTGLQHTLPDASSPLVKDVQDKYNVVISFKQKARVYSLTVIVRGSVNNAKKVQEAVIVLFSKMTGSHTGNLSSVPASMQLEIAPQHHLFIIGHGGANLKHIMQQTGASIHFPEQATVTAHRRGTVFISGQVENVFLARNALMGCLPLVLMFDVKDDIDMSQVQINKLMEQFNVFISMKPKPKQTSKSVIVKSIESNAINLHDARRCLLGISSGPNPQVTPQGNLFIPRLNVGALSNLGTSHVTTTPFLLRPGFRPAISPQSGQPAQVLIPAASPVQAVFPSTLMMVPRVPHAYHPTVIVPKAVHHPQNDNGHQSTSMYTNETRRSTSQVEKVNSPITVNSGPMQKSDRPNNQLQDERIQAESLVREHQQQVQIEQQQQQLLELQLKLEQQQKDQELKEQQLAAFEEQQRREKEYEEPKNGSDLLAELFSKAAAVVAADPTNYLLDQMNNLTSGNIPFSDEGNLQQDTFPPSLFPARPRSPPGLGRSNDSIIGSQSFFSHSPIQPRRVAVSFKHDSHTLSSGSEESECSECELEGANPHYMHANHDEPGTSLFDPTGLYESIDYEHKKLLATKAMQKKPEGESRTPTDYWAGLGFSKSMPDAAIRDKLGNKPNQYQGPTMSTFEEEGTEEEHDPVENIAESWNPLLGSLSPSNSFNRNITGGEIQENNFSNSEDHHSLLQVGTLLNIPSSEQTPSNNTSLAELFSKLGLGKYTNIFAEQEIDLGTFLTMNDEDLRELGITTFGARRKMLIAIRDLSKDHTESFKPSSQTSPFSENHGKNETVLKSFSLLSPRHHNIASQSGQW